MVGISLAQRLSALAAPERATATLAGKEFVPSDPETYVVVRVIRVPVVPVRRAAIVRIVVQCRRLVYTIFWELNGKGIPVCVHPRGSWRVLMPGSAGFSDCAPRHAHPTPKGE